MTDVTQIVLALIGLLSTIITTFLVPLLKNKLNDQQQAKLNTAIKIAVYAADQIFSSDAGKEKKQWVVNMLNEQGYHADLDVIDAQIEAMVKALRIEMGK